MKGQLTLEDVIKLCEEAKEKEKNKETEEDERI